MSKSNGRTVLGFHGCERVIGEKLLAGADFEPSSQSFDWLGPGVYFWENDPQRALEWALEKQSRGACDEPFVVGAVIELGHCLDLTTRGDLDTLSAAYDMFYEVNKAAGLPMPENRAAKRTESEEDKPLRFLDCAVISHLHEVIIQEAEATRQSGEIPLIEPFTTVRGLFIEGNAAYPGGGFYSKTHGQIAVCNQAAIRGVFVPRPYPQS